MQHMIASSQKGRGSMRTSRAIVSMSASHAPAHVVVAAAAAGGEGGGEGGGVPAAAPPEPPSPPSEGVTAGGRWASVAAERLGLLGSGGSLVRSGGSGGAR